MKLDELRAQFDKSTKSTGICIERHESGEYEYLHTYNMWCGYWMAAKDLGHISGDDAIWSNANN